MLCSPLPLFLKVCAVSFQFLLLFLAISLVFFILSLFLSFSSSFVGHSNFSTFLRRHPNLSALPPPLSTLLISLYLYQPLSVFFTSSLLFLIFLLFYSVYPLFVFLFRSDYLIILSSYPFSLFLFHISLLPIFSSFPFFIFTLSISSSVCGPDILLVFPQGL
jgi:hypothetical protein